MKEHKTDFKVDLEKNQAKRKMIWSFGTLEEKKISMRLEFH